MKQFRRRNVWYAGGAVTAARALPNDGPSRTNYVNVTSSLKRKILYRLRVGPRQATAHAGRVKRTFGRRSVGHGAFGHGLPQLGGVFLPPCKLRLRLVAQAVASYV